LKLNLTYKAQKDHQFAAEVSEDFQKKTFNITLGGQHVINDNLTFKAKIDKELNWALATKYKVNDVLTVTTSAQIALK